MEQKTLLVSQKKLILLKKAAAENAVRQAQLSNADLQNTINLCASELGIDIKHERWLLSDDISFFQKSEEPYEHS
jgi:hypothetical protein